MDLSVCLLWHMHQPVYLDAEAGEYLLPWVFLHAVKDYYEMARHIEAVPEMHLTVNFVPSLLDQLEAYGPPGSIPNDRFLLHYLADPAQMETTGRDFLIHNFFSAHLQRQILPSPRYGELFQTVHGSRGRKGVTLDVQDLIDLQVWFLLAWCGDTLREEDPLVSGLIAQDRHFTAEDKRALLTRLQAVVAEVVPRYRALAERGQIELSFTPYYHPILPLIYDSNLAKLCQPNDPMPERFHFPADAEAHVEKAIAYYKTLFGIAPVGMWPAEGSVAHDIVAVFGKHNVQWIATDEKILARSKPEGQPKTYPYTVPAVNGSTGPVAIVFRNSELSDRIGFTYQHWKGEDAAEDFVQRILGFVPQDGEEDELLTVILDGENAWEWYRLDNDGKEFQNALYRKLSKLHEIQQVTTVTMSEYLAGNEARGIPAHPASGMRKLEWLWPGSWINANYDTWIGEDEENKAWEFLLTARKDLEHSGLAAPAPDGAPSKKGTKSWYAYRAWESLYAAEGSDWFWWYGTDQTAPAGDKPFDLAYITHLNNIYLFAKKAGGKMPARRFEPIIRDEANLARAARGTMAQSTQDLVKLVLQCDANGIYVRKGIYVTGNLEDLGSWVPNRMKMFDDGTHGDVQAGDNVWTFELWVPPETEVRYKFTNSGAIGSWDPGEEFPGAHRSVVVDGKPGDTMILKDRFGVL